MVFSRTNPLGLSPHYSSPPKSVKWLRKAMNYEAVEETIKAGYREVSSQYRHDDEIEVTTPNHHRICATLQRICVSFSHPIKALDVGCGTGRYFHCLTNVNELTGMDISEEMLFAAENHPVRREMISVKQINVIRGNAYLASFPAESFYLIYSLGMFGKRMSRHRRDLQSFLRLADTRRKALLQRRRSRWIAFLAPNPASDAEFCLPNAEPSVEERAG